MLQPRIPHPLSPSTPTLSSLAASLSALHLTFPHPSHRKLQHRHASHASQGRANGPSDSAGRRLGLKKSATQYVVPGNIIFRQRGTKWHPGENVGLGRDHSIYATVAGYVRYYRDPARHKTRKYIGVSLERDGKEAMLPTPVNAVSRRRVGMYACPIKTGGSGRVGDVEAAKFLEGHVSENSKPASANSTAGRTATSEPPPIYRAGEYRIANVELVRQAERSQARVRPFDRKDRFYAWRVRAKRIKEKRLAKAGQGKGKKKAQAKPRQPRKK